MATKTKTQTLKTKSAEDKATKATRKRQKGNTVSTASKIVEVNATIEEATKPNSKPSAPSKKTTEENGRKELTPQVLADMAADLRTAWNHVESAGRVAVDFGVDFGKELLRHQEVYGKGFYQWCEENVVNFSGTKLVRSTAQVYMLLARNATFVLAGDFTSIQEARRAITAKRKAEKDAEDLKAGKEPEGKKEKSAAELGGHIARTLRRIKEDHGEAMMRDVLTYINNQFK